MKGFDHHCLWLNNCISSCNYRQFIQLLVFYLLHGILSMNLAISVHYLEQRPYEGWSDDQMTRLRHAKLALSSLAILVESIKSLATLALLLWHAYLARIGITTYQFLVEKEQLQKQKIKLALGEIE